MRPLCLSQRHYHIRPRPFQYYIPHVWGLLGKKAWDATDLQWGSFEKRPKAPTEEPARAPEDEIKGLNPSDALELLQSYDVPEAGLTQMIHAAYDLLG